MNLSHFSRRRSLVAIPFLAVFGTSLSLALDRPDQGLLTAEQFAGLHALIKPQPGESKWAEIPWLTNLPEARKRSAAEDKPLFVWRAGGGEVLGRA
jgi:hypothetical protein